MKSLQKRIAECIELRSKMQYLNIDEYEELAPFIEVMNRHIRDGGRYNGTIYLPSIGRKFVYALENKEGIESTVLLRAS